MDDKDTIVRAAEKAQHILTEYLQPGGRDCQKTINELIGTLDNQKVARAVERVDEARTRSDKAS
jgi:hypothetical protein